MGETPPLRSGAVSSSAPAAIGMAWTSCSPPSGRRGTCDRVALCPELPVEKRLQCLAGTEQANLDGVAGGAERGRRLVGVELLEVAQREHGPVARRQALDGPAYGGARLLPLEHPVAGHVPCRGRLAPASVVAKARQELFDRVLPAPTPAAELHERRVDDDAVQPRRQPRSAGNGANRLECREERLLDGVACILLGPHQAAGDRQHPTTVLADHRLEGLRVAVAEPADECAFVLWLDRCLLHRRRHPVALAEQLADEARAPAELRPVPLQLVQQANTSSIEELDTRDVQSHRTLPAEYRPAGVAELLDGLLRESTLDTEGLGTVGHRHPGDSHHGAHHPAQGTCRGAREARTCQELLERRALGREFDSRRPARSGRDISRIYERSSALRRMPSFCIRLRSVLGFRLSRRAAPCGPSIRQPVLLRVATMCWRSTSRRPAGPVDGASELAVGGGATVGTGSTSGATRRSGPGDRITARSMTFSSSRTLPGHG